MLALQLLTSFYLAYQITLSLVLLAATALLLRRVAFAGLLRLAAACVLPYALLAISAIPYRARESRGEIFASLPEIPADWDAVLHAAQQLAPRFDGLWPPGPGAGFFVPAGVALLAVAALGLAPTRRPVEAREARMRVAAVGLWVCAIAAFSLMLGARIGWGEHSFPLPASLAAALVPGFANLRSPSRWAIGVGIAAPVLAGLGLRYLEAALLARARPFAGAWTGPVLRGLVVLLLLVSVPWWQRVSTLPAWDDPEQTQATVAALRALPAGPTLEIPWHESPLPWITHDSRYMLASTRHWRPLLNGYTAYPPASSRFLRRVSQALPDAYALESLARLTDLRWIAVHVEALAAQRLSDWERAARRGDLRRVVESGDVWIFAMPRREQTGAWMRRLLTAKPRETTLAGLPRRALELPPGSGRLELISLPPLVAGSPRSIRLRVANRSPLAWPGLDPDPEGLVQLRVAFAESDGRVRKVLHAPLDRDLPAAAVTVLRAQIPPPRLRGRLELRLDLVQRIEGGIRALPVAPVEVEVEIAGREPLLRSAGGSRR